MNCKPGDLAFVANVTNPNIAPHVGRILRCVEVVHGDCWRTQPELEPGRSVYDGALRPIRDPGEDVPDASTAWLPPVPLHDEVTA